MTVHPATDKAYSVTHDDDGYELTDREELYW